MDWIYIPLLSVNLDCHTSLVSTRDACKSENAVFIENPITVLASDERSNPCCSSSWEGFYRLFWAKYFFI